MNIAARRLYNQQLTQTRLHTPAEVVAWLGAVQAQEYALAKWALGLRLNGVTDAVVEQAVTDGAVLRTHVMRPTWHFVTPDDIRWLLELTAPRVNAFNAYIYRKMELDEALFVRSNDAIARALEGGKQLTRSELALALGQAGITADSVRLGLIMMRAELDAVICSGARRGKQFTYALLAKRASHARTLPRDQALAELTKRFFSSHGPALPQDFAWWSGLTVADAKRGFEMNAGQLVQEVMDGKTYWLSASSRTSGTVDNTSPTALLLPPYDEYGIAYKDHSGILDPQHSELAKNTIFGGVIVIDGQILGYWRRTISKMELAVELNPFRPLTAAEREAVNTAAQQFGAFMEMKVTLSWLNATW